MNAALKHFAYGWQYPANVPPSKKTTTQALSDNLRMLMERTEMSQAELAKKSGVSQRTISNILAGTHEPGIEIVDKIARVFGLEGWKLQMRDLPPDLLGNDMVEQTLGALAQANPAGREMIVRLAEREAHFNPRQKR